MSAPQVGSHYDEKTGTYTNTWPAPQIPQKSLYEFVLGSKSFDDDTVAFVEHKKNGRRQITHGALKLEVHRLGAGLIKAGYKPGEVIMILSPNSIEWITVLLAAQFAGLTTALANPMYAAKEIQHTYKLVQPRCVFMPLKLSVRASQGRFAVNSVIAMDNSEKTATPSMSAMKVSAEDAKSAKPANITDFEQTAILAFSSGTTGMPKAVMMSHRNVVAMLTIITCFPDIYRDKLRVLTTLPFFHALALVLQVLLPTYIGSTVHIQVPFNAPLFLSIIESEKIESTSLVPPLALAFSRLPQVNKKTFASLRAMGCGGAPLDLETQKALSEKTGVEVSQGYGMTETTVGILGIHTKITPGTCGRVLPGVEVRLMDTTGSGKPVKRGERGELWARGPNVFKGYYKNQQATRDTMSDDGFLKTGDVAVANEKGEFMIVDRIKELIKYKGFQIAPAELEGLLNSHPKIAVAGVIGVYSKEQATELPRAYVQLRPEVDHTGMEEEIAEFVKKRATPTKWLRGGVIIVPQVPATPSGKLLRKDLRALAAKEQSKPQSKL